MSWYDITATCPNCLNDVNFEQFCDGFICSVCSVKLEPQHECYYDEENNDSYCADWLEVVEA